MSAVIRMGVGRRTYEQHERKASPALPRNVGNLYRRIGELRYKDGSMCGDENGGGNDDVYGIYDEGALHMRTILMMMAPPMMM